MAQSVILDPATQEARLVPNTLLAGHNLTGKTVRAVADDFSWDGHAVNWGNLTLVADLTRLRLAAVERVNDEAEAFRMRFLTPGAGQAATYLRKESEARGWLFGNDPATVPFLACEAENTGMTINAVAALVVAQADAWISMGSQIEGLRRGAAVAIAAATTRAQIDTAATVDWAGLLT